MFNKNNDSFPVPKFGILLEERLGVIINKNAKMPERNQLKNEKKIGCLVAISSK